MMSKAEMTSLYRLLVYAFLPDAPIDVAPRNVLRF